MTPGEAGIASALAAVPAGYVMSRWLRGRAYRVERDHPRRAGRCRWVLVAAPVVAGSWAAALCGHFVLWPVALLVGLGWLACAETDLDVHRIPDTITLPAWASYAVVLAVALLAGLVSSAAVLTALACSALLGGGAFVLGLATRQVGLGDVKLLALVGLVLGSMSTGTVMLAVLGASLAGLICSLYLLTQGLTRGARIAAGPGIVAGAVLAPLLSALLRP